MEKKKKDDEKEPAQEIKAAPAEPAKGMTVKTGLRAGPAGWVWSVEGGHP